jgi:hypothetical protein
MSLLTLVTVAMMPRGDRQICFFSVGAQVAAAENIQPIARSGASADQE